MSKTMREVMTPGSPPPGEVSTAGSIRAEYPVDEALRVMLERGVDRLSVIDGHEIIGSITPGELAISIEDARTWGALCK